MDNKFNKVGQFTKKTTIDKIEDQMKNKKKLLFGGFFVMLLAAFILITPWIQDRPRDNAAMTKNIMLRLMASLQDFKQDHGRYPTEKEGLKALYQASKSGSPYVNPKEEFFVDDWDGDLIYLRIDEECQLISYGADYEKGGTGFHNTDIIITSHTLQFDSK